MLSLGAFGVLAAAQGLPMADLQVYRAEGSAVWHGTDLYGFTVTEWDLPATYPPFAALLFVPAALVPTVVAKVVFLAGNVALLAWLIALSLRAVRGRPEPLPTVLALTALALWLEPVFQTLVFGQINLALACVVLWDMGRPDGARGKGFAVGLAAAVKLTPALFVVQLLLTGRVRAAGTAVAGFAAGTGVGALVLPGASVEFWTRRMFETARVGKAWIVDNQSLQGLVARLVHDPDPGPLWLVPAALLAAGGIWLARRLSVQGSGHGERGEYGDRRVYGAYGERGEYGDRRVHGAYGERGEYGDRRVYGAYGEQGAYGQYGGIMVTALVALLVSPISWSHHWVWCVPLLAGVAVAGWPLPGGGTAVGRRLLCACVALVFTARTLWLVPRKGELDLRLDWWQQPLASPYALLTLLLLGAAAGYGSAGRRPVPLTPRVPPARISVDGPAAHRRPAPAAARRKDGNGCRPECEEARGGRCAKHDAGLSADRDTAPGPRGAGARDLPGDHLGGAGRWS
ncbi:glycosyltransferase 87 family protein [Streptomyces albus]|uniref:glycosyltransferase 87 family protein n=1 Tax=Streptomyces albus TaxID=1888 RepID=UPI0031F6DB0B